MAVSLETSDLLSPEALAKTGYLELLSRRVVDGLMSGKHRSTHKGGCVEFSEYRAYTPGDEVRLIDWHIYAKSDRYYIKQFQEETNLQVMLVVDASGSMRFGMSTASKFDYARSCAACLARLVLRQRDAVGLAVGGSSDPTHLPPRSKASHLQALLAGLRGAEPSGDADLPRMLEYTERRIRRRGMFLIFSDGLCPLKPLRATLRYLAARGHEVLFFHTLAPEETSFSFRKWSRFECLENSGLRIEVDPPAIRKAYLKRLESFRQELKDICGEAGGDLVPLATDQDLGDALARYLRWRAAKLKSKQR